MCLNLFKWMDGDVIIDRYDYIYFSFSFFPHQWSGFVVFIFFPHFFTVRP